MTHIFYEFSSLKPGVPDVETLMEVINSSELTRFVMGAEVVDFVKKALIVNTTIGSFKNCYFAFDDGAYFLEFDGKGRMKPSGFYDRMVDVMEELVKFTYLTRDVSPYLVDRYSERKETGEALIARVNRQQ